MLLFLLPFHWMVTCQGRTYSDLSGISHYERTPKKLHHRLLVPGGGANLNSVKDNVLKTGLGFKAPLSPPLSSAKSTSSDSQITASAMKIFAKALVVASFTWVYFDKLLIPVSLNLLKPNNDYSSTTNLADFLTVAILFFQVQLFVLTKFFMW